MIKIVPVACIFIIIYHDCFPLPRQKKKSRNLLYQVGKKSHRTSSTKEEKKSWNLLYHGGEKSHETSTKEGKDKESCEVR